MWQGFGPVEGNEAPGWYTGRGVESPPGRMLGAFQRAEHRGHVPPDKPSAAGRLPSHLTNGGERVNNANPWSALWQPEVDRREATIRSEHITFPNAAAQRLSGRIDYPPTGELAGFALYAHCFTCTKNLRAIERITETLALHGLATLRFDFAGMGDSEGDFAETNFSTNVDDLVAAADYLVAELEPPEVLIGHSLGGAVALQGAARIPSTRAVVTIAAPASTEHIKRHLALDLDIIEQQGEAEVLLAGRSFTIRRQFIADAENAKLEEAIPILRRPLLVLHSPIDARVGIENAAEIFGLARHPKSFISLDGADHLVTNDADARFAAEVIVTWVDRYTTRDLVSHAQPDFVPEAP